MPFESSALISPYLIEEIKVRFAFSNGRVYSPIAYSPGGGSQSAVGCQVSRPQNLREVTFKLVRVGLPPVLPDCANAEAGEEMAEYDVVCDRVGRDSAETPTYQMQGRISFVRLDGLTPVPAFPEGLTHQDTPPSLPGIIGP